ncbi:cobalamin B12-binding domain-containing protein [Tundrisphaera lichenicola]|uniref:cobalamin B12-binding domain-containing protein n=1 Tax=Tundrisphaera lichenicola TaxID=2029860 RepID=UPI003EBA97E8
MPAVYHDIGKVISDRRSTLARAIVARQYSLQPDLEGQYGPEGRARCIQDTEHHLANLSEAVSASSPALFSDYLDWAVSVLAANHIRDEDVEVNLACLQDVLLASLPGEHGIVTRRFLEEAIRCSRSASRINASLISDEGSHPALARAYLGALLEYNRKAATDLILNAVDAGIPVGEIYLDVFQRCQREVGRLWQSRQIGVIQEHFATAVSQSLMARLTPMAVSEPGNGRVVMAASVGGERHEVGLRVVADFFEMAGYEVHYFGADAPLLSVAEAMARRRPDLLLISVTMVTHLSGVGKLIAAVRAREECRGVTILVGGHPFDVVPDLWRRSGADGYAADARGALVEAERLLATRSGQKCSSSPREVLPT